MRISSITKNAGKACNNRLYRHIRTFEKIVKNYFVIYEKHAYSLTDNREELERIEHRRWNIFMITHGFRYEKAERKDMYAKTHPCISKWEVLKVEKPDTLEYDFTPYYILKADR